MAEQDQSDQRQKNAKRYLAVAFFFFFLLALLWSVSSAFVYFFLGGGAVFLYLAIRSFSPVHGQSDTRNSSGNYGRYQTRQAPSRPENTNPPAKFKAPKFVAVILSVIIFSVIVSVVTAVFSDDDDSEFYYQAGNAYYETGKYDSAALFLRKALNSNPEYVDALIAYGNTKLALIQNDSAIIFYDKAEALEPGNTQARFQKGRTLYFNKDYERCIPLFKELVSDDSTNNDAIQLIGDSFYNQQRYDSAMVWYEAAYSSGFRNTYLCYLMGYICETRNNRDRAISLYKEAIQFDDTIADLYARLGALMPGREGEIYRTKAAKLESDKGQ